MELLESLSALLLTSELVLVSLVYSMLCVFHIRVLLTPSLLSCLISARWTVSNVGHVRLRSLYGFCLLFLITYCLSFTLYYNRSIRAEPRVELG